jgi:hypothetical protein
VKFYLVKLFVKAFILLNFKILEIKRKSLVVNSILRLQEEKWHGRKNNRTRRKFIFLRKGRSKELVEDIPRKPRVDKMKNRQAVIKCQVSASPLLLSILPPDPTHVFLSAFKSRASLTFDTRQNLLNPFNFNPSTLLDTIPTPSISACDTHFIPFSYLFARFISIFEKNYFLKQLIFFNIFKLFWYINIKNKF